MKTYSETAMKAWDEAMRSLPVKERNWPTVLEHVAQAVIAEHEKRTRETVWLVKDGAFYLCSSPFDGAVDWDVLQRNASGLDKETAKRVARDLDAVVVRVTRRRK